MCYYGWMMLLRSRRREGEEWNVCMWFSEFFFLGMERGMDKIYAVIYGEYGYKEVKREI